MTRVECVISADNTDTMELELCLDDHLEIDTATVIRDQRLLEVRLLRKISLTVKKIFRCECVSRFASRPIS